MRTMWAIIDATHAKPKLVLTGTRCSRSQDLLHGQALTPPDRKDANPSEGHSNPRQALTHASNRAGYGRNK